MAEVNLCSWPEISQASEGLQLKSTAATLEYLRAWLARLETRLVEHERRAAATLPPFRPEPDPPDGPPLYAATAQPYQPYTPQAEGPQPCFPNQPPPSHNYYQPPPQPQQTYQPLPLLPNNYPQLYAEPLNPPPPYVPPRQAYSYHEQPCWPVAAAVPQEPYTYSDSYAPLQNSYARYHLWQYDYQPTEFPSQPALPRSECPLQPPQPQQPSCSLSCSAPAPPPPVVAVLNATPTASQEKVEELSMSLEEALAKQAEESGDLTDCERDYDMLPKVVEFSEHNGKGDVRHAVEPQSQPNGLPIKAGQTEANASGDDVDNDIAYISVDLRAANATSFDHQSSSFDDDARWIPPRNNTRCLSILEHVDKRPVLALNFGNHIGPPLMIFGEDDEGRHSTIWCVFDPGGDTSARFSLSTLFVASWFPP